ncbi:MAG: hypothetical protein EBS29_11125 [Chloroflexia bacterium]|nr:hypothetical protein [Chloroflexia bacterium]
MNTLPYYSADEIKKALPMSAAIEVMRSAFQALHAGAVTMPVRLGTPQHVTGLVEVVRNPIYATGVGLLLEANKGLRSGQQSRGISRLEAAGGVLGRMKTWFQGNF